MRDGDLREQILGLEAQIEELAETIESCRKIIQISKAFIVVGGLLIAAITIGLIRFDPMLMIGALTAVVGGIVALGSNWSTSQQAVSTLKAAEAQRAELISKIDLRVVENRGDGPLRLD
jgi:cell division septum initiation protein DivIVA